MVGKFGKKLGKGFKKIGGFAADLTEVVVDNTVGKIPIVGGVVSGALDTVTEAIGLPETGGIIGQAFDTVNELASGDIAGALDFNNQSARGMDQYDYSQQTSRGFDASNQEMQYGQEQMQYGQEQMQYGQEQMQYGQEQMQYGQQEMQYGQQEMQLIPYPKPQTACSMLTNYNSTPTQGILKQPSVQFSDQVSVYY